MHHTNECQDRLLLSKTITSLSTSWSSRLQEETKKNHVRTIGSRACDEQLLPRPIPKSFPLVYNSATQSFNSVQAYHEMSTKLPKAKLSGSVTLMPGGDQYGTDRQCIRSRHPSRFQNRQRMPQSFEYRVRTVPRGQIILLSVNFYKTIFVWPPVVF